MSPPLKYDGLCPSHPVREPHCLHCEALWARVRRRPGYVRTRIAKPLKVTQPRPSPIADRMYAALGSPIYRELHWPVQWEGRTSPTETALPLKSL